MKIVKIFTCLLLILTLIFSAVPSAAYTFDRWINPIPDAIQVGFFHSGMLLNEPGARVEGVQVIINFHDDSEPITLFSGIDGVASLPMESWYGQSRYSVTMILPPGLTFGSGITTYYIPDMGGPMNMMRGVVRDDAVVSISNGAFADVTTDMHTSRPPYDIVIRIDGRYLTNLDVPPMIVDGRTLVPVRAVAEALGLEVIWHAHGRIDLYSSNQRIELNIGYTAIWVQRLPLPSYLIIVQSDVAPTIINDRTMLPIRVIAEIFGLDVDWDAVNRTVIITTQRANQGVPQGTTQETPGGLPGGLI